VTDCLKVRHVSSPFEVSACRKQQKFRHATRDAKLDVFVSRRRGAWGRRARMARFTRFRINGTLQPLSATRLRTLQSHVAHQPDLADL